jgi:hypothetical protein
MLKLQFSENNIYPVTNMYNAMKSNAPGREMRERGRRGDPPKLLTPRTVFRLPIKDSLNNQ